MYQDETQNCDPENLIHDTPFPYHIIKPCADYSIALNTTN